MVVYLICIDIESFIKHEVLISTSWHAHVHCTNGAHGAMCAMMYMVQCVPWCMCNGVLGAMCASFFQIHPVECSGAASTKRTDCGSSRCSMCIYVLCEAMCYVQLYASMCYVHIVQLSCARFRWFSWWPGRPQSDNRGYSEAATSVVHKAFLLCSGRGS